MPEEIAEDEVIEEAVEQPVEEPVSEGDESETQESAPASPWDNFKTLPEFQGADEQQIAARLYETMQREQAATQALRQYQAVVPAASEYLTYREPFQQWLQQRQQQQQQPAPQPAKAEPEPAWWSPPPLKESDRQYLTTDDNGRVIISDSAPLDARSRLAEHQAYKAQFAQKFLENPENALGPMIEKIVTDRAQNIAQERIAALQEENFVRTVEEQNKDWLYDQNGNAAPAGLLVQKYIEDARQLGIKGAEQRWNFATRMVERDMLLTQYQQAAQVQQAPPPTPEPAPQPAESPAERNMEYLRQQATRRAPVRAAANTTNARSPQRPMTFAERLTATLQEEGLAEQ